MNARNPEKQAQDNELGLKFRLFNRVNDWLIPHPERSSSTTAHLVKREVVPCCNTVRLELVETDRPDDDLDVCTKCLRVAIRRGRLPREFADLVDDDHGGLRIDVEYSPENSQPSLIAEDKRQNAGGGA